MKAPRFALAVAIAATATLTACSVTFEDIPLPTTGMNGSAYEVHAYFTDAMNLPFLAKVKLDGADVGQARSVDVANNAARVTMRIQEGVELPRNVEAQLRQATPLGDVYVALRTPVGYESGADPVLDKGGSIALDATSQGASVEDLLSSASLVINGGGLAQIQGIITELDSAVSGRAGEVTQLINQLTGTVTSLNERSAEIDAVLADADQLTELLASRGDEIDRSLETLAPLSQVLADNTDTLTATVVDAGLVSQQLARFNNEAGDATRSLMLNAEVALGAIAEIDGNLNEVLGVVADVTPDIEANMQGNSLAPLVRFSWISLSALSDPSSHWPGHRDYEHFIGSLTDTLNRVYGRITGQGLSPEPAIVHPDEATEGTR